MSEKMLLAVAMAAEFVQRARAEAPEGYDVYAYEYGSSDSSSSSAFRRTGSSSMTQQRTLPAELAALIQSNFRGGAVDGSVGTANNGFLLDLLTQNSASLPGQSILETIQAINPTSFTGSSALESLISRNPFSTNYEEATQDLFDRQYATARSAAQSGPQNVRGGQGRQALELASLGDRMAQSRFQNINEAQNREAGVVAQASQIHQAIEAMRRGSQLQAQNAQQQGVAQNKQQMLGASQLINQQRAGQTAGLASAGDLLGTTTQTQAENIKGRGNQSSSGSQWNAGITCCFIFLEALNGELPDYVRQGRDEYVTEERARGYRWMARWLVPRMQRSKFWRKLVNLTMVRPFLMHGEVHYNVREGFVPEVKWLLSMPVCWAWIGVWQLLGNIVKKG
jgi:hypothetical protein